MKLTIDEFLDFTKVMRMLYGKQVAIEFFEKNLYTMTNLTMKDLHNLKQDAKLRTTHVQE